MKKIIITDDTLAQVSASIISSKYTDAPGVIATSILIAYAELGATLFDGVEDDCITEIKIRN